MAAIAATIASLFVAPASGAPAPEHPRQAEARTIVQHQLKRFGPDYQGRFDLPRHLVYVSALDEQHFRRTAQALALFADGFRKTLGVARPQWIITVVLPTVEDYRPLAPAKDVAGFYSPADRTLISIDRGRVLLHEFVHALHHADVAAARQSHPIWLVEGLATLFEACNLTPLGLRPQVNLRLLTLQKAIRTKQTIPLERLITLTPKAFNRDALLCYAESRYLLLYLHQQGRLRDFYRTYKAAYAKDRTGKHALEKILGKRLFEFEDDWQGWATQLQLPWGERQSGEARLGMQMQDTINGVKVVGFVKGSVAERAGRIKVGDIILKFNGQKVTNTAEAVGAIHAAGAMQTVTIELSRQGRPLTIHQPLGAAPRP